MTQASPAFDFFEGLEEVPLDYGRSERVAPAKAKPTFTCPRCGGSGKYAGFRLHQNDSECFPCGGRGYFLKPYGDAMKDRAKRKAGRETARADRLEAFDQEHPGLRAWIGNNSGWSKFLGEMGAALAEHGKLTEGQLAAVIRTKHKCDARQVERQIERAAEADKRAVDVDLSTIHAMFDRAARAALEKRGATGKILAYRAAGLILSPAKATSANAGGIYVKTTGGEYLGKVMGTRFMAQREATDEHKATLARIAADPSKEARDYGKESGICSCCGRRLTDPNSLAAGIGPVCAEGWGSDDRRSGAHVRSGYGGPICHDGSANERERRPAERAD